MDNKNRLLGLSMSTFNYFPNDQQTFINIKAIIAVRSAYGIIHEKNGFTSGEMHYCLYAI